MSKLTFLVEIDTDVDMNNPRLVKVFKKDDPSEKDLGTKKNNEKIASIHDIGEINQALVSLKSPLKTNEEHEEQTKSFNNKDKVNNEELLKRKRLGLNPTNFDVTRGGKKSRRKKGRKKHTRKRP